jgi:hypothetical protein
MSLHDSIDIESNDDPWVLSPNEQDEISFSVTNEWKFVYVNVSTRENIDGGWVTQPVCPEVTLTSPANSYTITIGNPLSRIPITTENTGEWNFKVTNSCENQIQVRFAVLLFK